MFSFIGIEILRIIGIVGTFDYFDCGVMVFGLTHGNAQYLKIRRNVWSFPATALSDDSDFSPNFDGQLFYGLEQKPGEKEIVTTKSELREISARLNKQPSESDIDVTEDMQNNIVSENSSEAYSFQWGKSQYQLRPRRVPLSDFIDGASDVTVLELDSSSTQELVESWMMEDKEDIESRTDEDFDPFGVVMWPGSIIASEELYRFEEDGLLKDKEVLVLGAGTGVEVQVAAKLGARRVTATDNNPMTLSILEASLQSSPSLQSIVHTKIFDIFSNEPLPSCDILVAADVLYNKELAEQVGKRFAEALSLEMRPAIIVTDSQRFHGTDFLQQLKDTQSYEWNERCLDQVQVSGILIQDDQKVNVKARLLSIPPKPLM